ncbi:FAD:protein FMN transferase [Limosilactobacillus caecicola]|uniref:FAD:protein FMN transferase n=1 Tax=Limosilactobacillus caecicola TaxID=2941332 RepID=UPI00203FBA37|nr:FAD:protein FMN transferase [Limosilactobacillus caecicola]
MSVNRQVHLMGTIIKISLANALPNDDQLAEQAVEKLRQYEQIFSANDDRADLMRVNQQAGIAPVIVKPELFNLIKLGQQASLNPDGYLNIAIGPLVKLWHIGFNDAHVPTDDQIQKVLPLTDPHQIVLNEAEQSVFLKHSGMEIDLGAVAKGYSADLLKNFLTRAGVTSGVLNLGGNVVVIGGNRLHADGQWHVGLQDPKQALGHYVKIIPLRDQSIVTSGIYERNLTSKGHFYHHIFNPHTGYPIETNLASLSIISPRSVDGEIWTSQLFGKSWEQIVMTVHGLPQMRAIGIFQNGEVRTCE